MSWPTPDMKKIGIMGGMGWASTVDYYRLINSFSNAHFAAQGYDAPLPGPPIMIDSVVQHATRALRGVEGDEASWEGFDAHVRDALLRLEAGGCDILMMASNTPHMRIDSIRRGLGKPLLSIIDATARAAKLTAPKALILGTSVTMRSSAYADALRAMGVAPLAGPQGDEIDAFQGLIDSEFYGGASARAQDELLAFCRAHVEDRAQTAVLLACTELPLAFPEHVDDAVFEAEGFTFVNASVAHVRAALAVALGEATG